MLLNCSKTHAIDTKLIHCVIKIITNYVTRLLMLISYIYILNECVEFAIYKTASNK